MKLALSANSIVIKVLCMLHDKLAFFKLLYLTLPPLHVALSNQSGAQGQSGLYLIGCRTLDIVIDKGLHFLHYFLHLGNFPF